MFTTGSKLLVGAAIAGDDRRHRLRRHPGRRARHDRPDQRGGRAGLPRRRQPVRPRLRRVGDGHDGAHRPSPAAAPVPGPSMWPIVGALGAVLVVVGLVTYPVVFVFGILALLAAAVEWMVQAWSERASADVLFNDNVRSRIAHPLEFPILAAVGAGDPDLLVQPDHAVPVQVERSGGVRGHRRADPRRRVRHRLPAVAADRRHRRRLRRRRARARHRRRQRGARGRARTATRTRRRARSPTTASATTPRRPRPTSTPRRPSPPRPTSPPR